MIEQPSASGQTGDDPGLDRGRAMTMNSGSHSPAGLGPKIGATDTSDPRCARRRNFLAGLAGLGAAALGAGDVVFARTDASPRRIDVHHHFIPKNYHDYLQANNRNGGGTWELSTDLDDMDRNGTASAILTITTPGFPFGQTEGVRKIIRECNDAAAELGTSHPGRFGSFAAIPMIDAEGSLREIEYALDTLKADGIGVYSSYGDKWLGDPAFVPVYEELNRRKAVIYVHPTTANCCVNLMPRVPNEGASIEYGTDTTRTIADLIFSGTTTRFPDITWIFSHGGGTMPFLIERFLTGASAEIVPGIVTKGMNFEAPKLVPRGVLYELRKMYYDTAQASNPVAMGALRKVVLPSQIVYGTDYWYRTAAETARGLITSKIFSDKELRAINRENAARLLPRFRT